MGSSWFNELHYSKSIIYMTYNELIDIKNNKSPEIIKKISSTYELRDDIFFNIISDNVIQIEPYLQNRDKIEKAAKSLITENDNIHKIYCYKQDEYFIFWVHVLWDSKPNKKINYFGDKGKGVIFNYILNSDKKIIYWDELYYLKYRDNKVYCNNNFYKFIKSKFFIKNNYYDDYIRAIPIDIDLYYSKFS